MARCRPHRLGVHELDGGHAALSFGDLADARIEQPDQPQQSEVPFDLTPACDRWSIPASGGDGQDPGAAAGKIT